MTPSVLLLTAAWLTSVAPPPALPIPPAPPSSSQILAAHLAAGLLADSEVLPAPAAYEVRVAGAERAELSELIADTLEAALRRGGADASRVESGGTHRIDLRLVSTKAELSASARLVRLPRSVWEGLRDPGGAVLATATAGVGLDLELRALSGQARAKVRVDKLRAVSVAEGSSAALLRQPLLDVLVLDLDGDRRPEVLWLQPDGIVATRWDHGGFSWLAEVALDEIPPAVTRARDPLGRLIPVPLSDGRTVVVAATTDRSAASVWRLSGAGLERVDVGAGQRGWPLYATAVERWATRGWPQQGTDVLDDPLVEEVALGGVEPSPLLSWPEPAHAVRAFALRTLATLSWDPHFALSDPGQGVRIWSARQPDAVHAFPSAGTVVALGDLDANGQAEALLTSGALDGRDTLSVHRLSAGRGSRRTQWRHDLPAPVSAASAGDVDTDGYEEFVVATWDGLQGDLWIVAPRVSR